jgi:hypothetical protein
VAKVLYRSARKEFLTLRAGVDQSREELLPVITGFKVNEQEVTHNNIFPWKRLPAVAPVMASSFPVLF